MRQGIIPRGTTLLVMLFALVIICLVSGCIGTFCIPYTINTWLLFTGKEATVTSLNGFLIGLFPPLGFLSIVISIMTWIAMLFLL